ncbi:uncharacterized protein PV07_00862 [Cladophialophora immunda]|uniref:AB hydrolase-1 domain-containing protein n=1 Tax=Cladophialophora immunda TaxID=569365 RepID=A0A0D2B8X5_9EURO|nr:uncharacterized protein PV07_00862 [Cladophialophora immunda]KIW34062.1 hypothetical protein PV07_00862 [Cladophialophora immunda]
MIGTSTFDYIWVKSWVVILHSIAPICVAYCVSILCLPTSWRLPAFFEYWALAETIFCLIFYLYQRRQLQRPALHPPVPSQEERQKLFHLCQESTQDVVRYLSGWFFYAPLTAVKRENVKEFFRWAFLNTDLSDPTYDDEVEEYVKSIELGTGLNFEDGRADVKCLRLTLDKVDALHRSLVWYSVRFSFCSRIASANVLLCIFIVDIVTHAYMRFHHFHHYRASIRHFFDVFPLRPQTLLTTHRAPAENLTYWYRPHTSRTELPILFLHGIGVGLYPYMEYLKELNQGRQAEDGVIGILALEILPISSRITSPLLRKQEMCQQLQATLRHHGFERYILVSHSYGSVISTHLLKTPDLASMIAAVILVDPISILLHQPDVAYNFIIRRPKFANEWLLWYFGSKDVGVAHTLSRTFFWSENILWKDDLLSHPATVFLNGKDSIINAPLVYEYLQATLGDEEEHTNRVSFQGDEITADYNSKKAVPEKEHSGDGRLKVVWCPDLDHGEVFDKPSLRKQLVEETLARARGDFSVQHKGR